MCILSEDFLKEKHSTDLKINEIMFPVKVIFNALLTS